MTRHFCDLCGAETTDARRIKLELADIGEPDYSRPLTPASLIGNLYPREVCGACAWRAIQRPAPSAPEGRSDG
jgi:hypothetical protein